VALLSVAAGALVVVVSVGPVLVVLVGATEAQRPPSRPDLAELRD
jgi:hypothetical protein